MPARILAFPFRINPDGSAATVECDSDAEFDQGIAVAALTVPGERIQVPTFGIADPAFSGFEVANLARHLLDFGPPVDVTAVKIRPTSDGREQVAVEWVRKENDR